MYSFSENPTKRVRFFWLIDHRNKIVQNLTNFLKNDSKLWETNYIRISLQNLKIHTNWEKWLHFNKITWKLLLLLLLTKCSSSLTMSKATITVKCKSWFVKNLTFKIEVHGEVAVEDRNEDLVKYGDIQSTRVGLQTDLHTQIQHILLGHLQLTGLEPRRDINTWS